MEHHELECLIAAVLTSMGDEKGPGYLVTRYRTVLGELRRTGGAMLDDEQVDPPLHDNPS
jgi:hypothetical protein